jgi:hypothetical protein
MTATELSWFANANQKRNEKRQGEIDFKKEFAHMNKITDKTNYDVLRHPYEAALQANEPQLEQYESEIDKLATNKFLTSPERKQQLETELATLNAKRQKAKQKIEQ